MSDSFFPHSSWSPNSFDVYTFEDDLGFSTETSSTPRLGDSNTHLYCSGVTLPKSKIQWKRHPQTNRFVLDKIDRDTTVTIDWVEDSRFTVFRFHQIWFSKIYDRDTDTIVVGAKGKVKRATIRLWDPAMPSLQRTPPKVATSSSWIASIELRGLLPQASSSDFSLSWNKDSGDTRDISLSYNVTSVSIEFNENYLPEIGLEEGKFPPFLS